MNGPIKNSSIQNNQSKNSAENIITNESVAQTEKKTKGAHHSWLLWTLFGAVIGLVGISLYVIFVAPITIGPITIGQQNVSHTTIDLDKYDRQLDLVNKKLENLNGQLNTLEESAITDDISDQIQSLTNDSEQVQQVMIALQSKIAGYGELVQSMAAMPAANRQRWLLDEIGYLARLAQQRVVMAQDAESAKYLLQTADELLAMNDDLALYPIREAIGKDIALLDGVTQVNENEIYAVLNKASQKVGSLPLLPDFQAQNDVIETIATDSSQELADNTTEKNEKDDTWYSPVQNYASDAWSEVKSLVTVRRLDEPIEPLLLPEQEYYLRLNLSLMLEQAQLALLMRNDLVFQQSLEKTKAWLMKYFQFESEQLSEIMLTISQLEGIQLNREMPDIMHTQMILKKYLSDLNKLVQPIDQGSRKIEIDDKNNVNTQNYDAAADGDAS